MHLPWPFNVLRMLSHFHQRLTSSFSNSSTRPSLLSSITNAITSYNPLVSQAVKFLGPPARFEASKLKVVVMEDQINKHATILPRTYILSHCDFTANLTLTVSNYCDQPISVERVVREG